MVGYTRQDTANNIANGNVIDADDLDSEFNAIEDAFNSTSGHSHDGSAGQGAAISKVGPGQDIIVGTTNVLPKANNIMDLGSQAAQFKDAWFDGTVSTDTLIVGNNSYTNISNNEYDVTSGGLTFDVAGDITLDADGGDVVLKDGGVTYGSLKGVSNELSIYSGTTEALALTGADVVARGDLDVTTNATVGGTMSVTGNMTIPTANLTLNSGNAVIGGTLGVTGLITGNISTLSNHTTSGLTEGTNLYYTTARAQTDAKTAISVTDAGGDGSVTYSAGTITYTGPSASETRAHFSAGTGVAYSGGQFSIGQAVGTSSNVTFNNAIVNGNLTVNGTTTTVNSNDVNIGDATLTLNSDETGTPSQDAGITIERGTSDNKSFLWDESEDEWSVFGERIKAGTFEGDLTGSVTGNVTGNVVGDLTGNVVGDLTGNVAGNTSTATALQTSRTIALTGDVTGSVAFDGSANASITATVQDDSHNHILSNIDGITVSETELNSVSGITSNIQAQLTAVQTLISQGVPSGAVQAFAMSSAPTGWLACDGAAVSRTTYASLFAALGTQYGSGNGSTTFKVPDLRGEFVRGWDDGRGVDSGRGFGSYQAVRTNNLARINYTYGDTTNVYTNESGSPTAALRVGANVDNVGHKFYLRGGETRPRNVALLYCIKT